MSEINLNELMSEKPELRERLRQGPESWELDVRGLKMPAPMELTLRVLELLPANFSLVQVNERVPQFLFAILEQRGFTYDVKNSDGTVRTTLRKK